MQQPTEIISARWNPSFTAFSVATQTGFMICAAFPQPRYLFRLAKGKGFCTFPETNLSNYPAIVEMHPDFTRENGSKILALVGGGRTAHFPKTKVIIWDCSKDDRSDQEKAEFPGAELNGAIIGEIGLRTEVLNVKLHRNALFVALIDKVPPTPLFRLLLVDSCL